MLRPIKTPSYAIDLIKEFEGCVLTSYQDVVGVWTIGYGHTKTAKKGMKITLKQAENLLKKDLIFFERAVFNLTKVPLTEYQYGALVSFCFNLGSGAYQRSTLRQKLNRGDYLGAANEFWKWRRAGGVILKGLVRRREAEKKMFLGNTNFIHL